MRKPVFPKEGYIFRHKENKDIFARVLYLADGESIDDYKQITELEYEGILVEREEYET
jgi:hypothetical protein